MTFKAPKLLFARVTKFPWIGSLFCIALAGVLWNGGLPSFPMDDLHFLGPVLDLLDTGRLLNRFAETQLRDAGIELNLGYPPIFYYTLALWLKICGLSTTAILSFEWMVILGFGWALSCLLSKFGLPSSSVVLSAPVWMPMFAYGIRPDPLAYLMALLSLLIFRLDHSGWCTISVMWMGLACFTYPLAAAIIVPFVAIRFIHEYPAFRRDRRLLRPFAVGSLAGAALCCLMVSWAVEWQFIPLLKQLFQSRQGHFAKENSFFRDLVAILTVGKIEWMNSSWILTSAVFGGYCLVSKTKTLSVAQRHCVMGLSVSTLLALLIYPLVGRFLAYAMGCVLAALVCNRVQSLHFRKAAFALLLTWSVFTQLPAYVRALFSHPPSSADIDSVVNLINTTKKKVRIDASVARFCYDYKVPRSVTSLFYNTTNSEARSIASPLHLSSKPEDEVWIISHTSARVAQMNGGLKGLDSFYQHPVPVRLLGRTFLSVPVQEKFVVIE